MKYVIEISDPAALAGVMAVRGVVSLTPITEPQPTPQPEPEPDNTEDTLPPGGSRPAPDGYEDARELLRAWNEAIPEAEVLPNEPNLEVCRIAARDMRRLLMGRLRSFDDICRGFRSDYMFNISGCRNLEWFCSYGRNRSTGQYIYTPPMRTSKPRWLSSWERKYKRYGIAVGTPESDYSPEELECANRAGITPEELRKMWAAGWTDIGTEQYENARRNN